MMKLSVFTLLSLAGAALAAPSALTSQNIHPNGNTAKCLGAASNADGAAVIIQDCSGGSTGSSASQLWTVTSAGTLQIFGDKCLDDTNGNQANGTKMQIFTCFSGNTNQKWAQSQAGGSIELGTTNKCLDNTGGLVTDGNPAQIWGCTGGPNQKWTISNAGPPPAKGNQIQPGSASSECLTVAGNTDNAAVTIEKCDGSATQAWTVTGGTVQIFGNKCLDVPNGSTTNGVKMQIYTCFAGNTNQQFTVTGDKRIAWTNKGECLDLTDGNVNPGTAAQMWKCTDNDNNQVWNIV